jgi:para-nitrobenzyl esterase
VRGRVEAATAVFLGVPYAAPPIGEDRFAPPRPPRPWDGVRDALVYGASAPQPHRQFTLIPEPVIPGDDCLNLNVFTPDLGATGLPVLVWIHGGGFVAGCNASPWYRGHRFARDGVVVVSVNYRLGVDGFLAVEDAPANRGVLDLVAALGWVQDNIARFGGDPGQVTIAGQSAGGMACGTLLATPRARGMFGRAILMSGTGHGMAGPEAGAAQAKVLGEIVDAPVTRAGLAGVPRDRLFAAQDELAARRNRGEDLPRLLGPVVDGEVVNAPFLDLVRAGATNDVPAMVGATAEEFNAGLRAMAARFTDEDRVSRRLARLGLREDAAAAFRAAHPGAEGWELMGQAITDAMFRAPAAHFAEERAASGAPVFAYEFGWRSTAMDGLGAAHCLDVPFVFDVLDAPGVAEVIQPEPPQDLADAMHGAWVRFVRDGDAGWPRYESGTRAVMAFYTTSAVRPDAWHLPRTLWPLADPTTV